MSAAARRRADRRRRAPADRGVGSNASHAPPLQICKVIAHVAKRESLALPSHVAPLLARLSRGNLRRALLSLEALHTQDPSFASVPRDVPDRKLDTLAEVPRPDWETYCSKTAEKILAEQTPERLLEVRGMIYELLVHCIPAQVIISVRHFDRERER